MFVEIQPLSVDMLRRYCENRTPHYYTDSDGDVLFLLSPATVPGVDLSVYVSIAGPGRSVLSVEVRSSWTFAVGDTPALSSLLNNWPDQYRWPRPYLRQRTCGNLIDIILDGHLDTITGIHQAFVDDFVRKVVCASIDFWEAFRSSDYAVNRQLDALLRELVEGEPPNHS